MCASCMMDRSHRGHQVEPLDKALEKRKDKLREVLERVNSKTQEIEKILQNLTGNVSKIQGKANGLTKGINELFEDVIRQLEVLKDTLTAEVLLKTEQSLLPMTDHIQELEEEKKELLRSKCRIEELCHMDNPFTVLQEHQRGLHDRVTRSDAHSSQELDVGQITRTLQTRLADITSGGILCFYMQEPTDLLLDVTTASNNVHISEDRRSATYTEFVQNLPDSSQRFPLISQVLSTRGFSSGRHYWDVETSHTGNWRVGVCYPSMDRKGGLSNIGYNSKSWCLRRCFGELGLRHNSQCLPLSQVSSCNHMRVYLDYEAGQLSFYELSDSIRHLHTFTATFTEPLHAAFMVFEGWLRVKGTRPGGTVRDSGVGL
ncbi:E3 ubiquitin-protein ligase TRIM39-like [Hyla sarda]|uniref:E3 ubiquitin-protein ligase TRIM39-like n=1 Tax=Hyla sarda TaxID=327740 RepID=UPI0024C46EAD|nr:E3 ubiquitin-protein ligase TRIM39-like [Hyla sarda]